MDNCEMCNEVAVLRMYHGNRLCPSCYEAEEGSDDYDDEDYYEDLKEQEAEEKAILAATCKCGAWVFHPVKGAVHVADCCCGAE